MERKIFISIDFDGTVTETDITDAVIQEFAKPGWEHAEELWERGIIGSQECLSQQMGLIDTSLDTLFKFVDRFTVEKTFGGFIDFLHRLDIPFAILSDGFEPFIERILCNAGLKNLPLYASRLKRGSFGLETLFPHAYPNCSSGTCKCAISEKLSRGLPIIHIGDGQSDFCIVEKVAHVFTKKRLTAYCSENGIPHSPFHCFSEIERYLSILLIHMSKSGAEVWHGEKEKMEELWNQAR